jgi:hypothetical protein
MLSSWWRKCKVLAFGIGWFLIAILPVSGLVLINVSVADRFVYVAGVGVFLPLAMTVAEGQVAPRLLQAKEKLLRFCNR